MAFYRIRFEGLFGVVYVVDTVNKLMWLDGYPFLKSPLMAAMDPERPEWFRAEVISGPHETAPKER